MIDFLEYMNVPVSQKSQMDPSVSLEEIRK